MAIAPEDDYIGVRQVAELLNLTDRAAWELIKRLGVSLLDGDRRMSQVRFLRRDWDAARRTGAKPAAERAPARPSYVPATTGDADRPKAKARTESAAPAVDWATRYKGIKI